MKISIPAAIEKVVEKHLAVYPSLGKPIAVFEKDGCPYCVRYANGEWFHYSADGRWY